MISIEISKELYSNNYLPTVIAKVLQAQIYYEWILFLFLFVSMKERVLKTKRLYFQSVGEIEIEKYSHIYIIFMFGIKIKNIEQLPIIYLDK